MSSESFFKVPTDFQLRFRELSAEEARLFASTPMKPSPYSAIRSELDAMIESMKFADINRGLVEKAFQILINIDQRLDRIEEDVQNLVSGKTSEVQNFQWFHGELGVSGFTLDIAELGDNHPRAGAVLLLDLLLPSMPEHRVVCTATAEKDGDQSLLFLFTSIHDDDREFLHRFVASKEREMLRARASKKKESNPSE